MAHIGAYVKGNLEQIHKLASGRSLGLVVLRVADCYYGATGTFASKIVEHSRYLPVAPLQEMKQNITCMVAVSGIGRSRHSKHYNLALLPRSISATTFQPCNIALPLS